MPEHSLTPELLAAYSVVADPQLSPNGEWVLYTIGEASHEGEHPNGAVWLTSFRDGGARQFTAGTALDAASRWSPDGGAIAFVSDRAEPGKPRLYTVPFAGGEATLVETPPGEVSDPRWSPDGACLAYRLTEPETEEDKRRKEERDDVEVAGETYKYARLFVTHLDTGESRRISAEKRHVRDFDWSPDGGRLAVATADTPEDDEDHLPGRIEVFDLESGEARTLAEPLGAVLDLRWSPDGERVAYVGMASRSGAAEAVCVLPVENGEPVWLTESYGGSATGLRWLPDGDLAFTAYEGLYGAHYRLTLDGDRTNLLPKNERACGSITSSASWSADGARYVLTRSTGAMHSEVWGGESDGEVRRLTHSNPEIEPLLSARTEAIEWRAADGIELQGVLIYPAKYQADRSYPMVVQPHGGPAWLWSDRAHASWHDWGQYLAANGYAVLLPNPRGSIGRGPSFTTAGFDDVGGGEWTDILAGVDHVVELGVADPDLLGIGGWSWGGYLTAWGITQTTRFKAAVVGAGVTNLFSDQGNSNLTHFYDYLFSTNAYTDPDAYVRRSPICCVSNVVTPTLVLHGAEDAVVNRAQGQELYNALRYLGQEVEMAIYPREGHGFKERRHQLDLIRRVLEWFDRHLKRESE